MTHVLFWLLQDLLTVLTWGSMQIPEIFLFSLVYRLLTRDREANIQVIWMAFAGGLFWDLRWVGFPGFFILNYLVAVMAVIWVWNTLPLPGRTPLIIFLLFWGAQLLPAVLSAFILVRNVGTSGWLPFLVQQGCVLPLALSGVFFCSRHLKDQNA